VLVRISSVHLYHVAMPLKEPWKTAFGEDQTVETVLAEVQDDNGLSAWAEATPLGSPRYSSEWAGGAFAALRDFFAPTVIGKDFASGSELQDALGAFKGHQFAKSLLDIAWYELASSQVGQPLHKFLGGDDKHVEVGADFGVRASLDELVAKVGSAVDLGYRRVKLKARPGWDAAVVRLVRREFPDLVFHIDCNGGYTLGDLDLFKQLDDQGLAMIEQPLAVDDLIDHAKLQAQLTTPVCLDESITSPARMRQAVEIGSCRYVNIKPGRVGGLTNAIRIHDICAAAQIPAWVGGMQESSIGAAVCTALATLDNFVYPADIFPSDWFYSEDLAAPPVRFGRGDAGQPCAIPDTLGSPVRRPAPDLLERWAIRQALVGPGQV